MAGSHEVRGSIPLGSTIETLDQDIVPGLFIFCSNGGAKGERQLGLSSRRRFVHPARREGS